jgi:nicotinate-nucleotide adenylyltransferase
MIGILGGTFDPPHNAHLKIAEYCLNTFPLENLVFMPCYLPVLKQEPRVSAAHRLAMITAAIGTDKKLTIDDREIKRAELSYTIDTLHSIREEIGKNTALCFIMGRDAFNQLLQWKDWQGILRLCHLIIVNRPGYVFNQD